MGNGEEPRNTGEGLVGNPCVTFREECQMHVKMKDVNIHIDEQVFDREAWLCALLDLDAILILIRIEHIGNIPPFSFVRAFDSNHARFNSGFNHIRVHHGTTLLAHHVTSKVNATTGRATEHGSDQSARIQTSRT